MSDRIAVLLRNVSLAALALAPVAAVAQAPAPAQQQPSAVAAPEANALATPPAAQQPGTASAAPQSAGIAGATTEAAVTTPAPAAQAGPAARVAPLIPQTGPVVPGGVQPNPENVTVSATQTSGIAAIVNDFVISDYDLNQRTALFVATSGARPTPETINQIRGQVLRALEDEVLELQEAQKHKINIPKSDVDKAIQNIADDNHVKVDQIADQIKSAGVAIETLRQQIAAQLTWQRLVTARYGTDILVTDQQVDEQMDRLKQGSDKPQFLVSEIFLSVNRADDEMSVRDSAEQLVKQLKQGASFTTIASQFSQSPSAAEGGDIGWVVQGQLSEDEDKALVPLKPGDIAGPIRAEGGYYVLQLRDRREPAGTKVEESPTLAAYNPDSPLPLDRLLIPLPPNPDDMLKQRAMALAETLHMQVQSCEQLPAVSSRLQGTQYTRLGQMNPKDLAPNVREALAKTTAGQMVPPFFSQAGLEIIMRCDTPPRQPTIFKMPTRDEVQQQLFVQQMSVFAKSYLAELRRDAVVETR